MNDQNKTTFLGMVQLIYFFFQAVDGIRVGHVTGVQTCALPIYAGQVRVRLQDLEVEVVGGQLQVRGGRVIGDLPAGLIPLSGGRASEYLQAERIEFTRERGLLVEAALALPGTDQIRMSGEAHLTLAGVYGYLEASGRPGEPLLRIGGEPVALQVERAGVRLPQGDLDLVSRVELFGFESPCDEVYADINEDGVWERSEER